MTRTLEMLGMTRTLAMLGMCGILFSAPSVGTSGQALETTGLQGGSKAPSQIVVRKFGSDFQKSAKNRVTPVYPPGVRISGPVVIEVRTHEDGSVEAARAISGPPLLISSAVEAVRQWTWEPTLVDGEPAKVIGVISIVFNQDGSVSVDPVVEVIVNARGISFDTFRTGESSELLAKLKDVPEIAIQVVNPNDSPIEITDTKVQRLEREPKTPGEEDTTPSTFEPYAMSARIHVAGRGAKGMKGALLQFASPVANNTFFVYTKAASLITWLRAGKSDELRLDLLSLSDDPSSLVVQVAGALFEDGTKWGAWEEMFPHAPYPPISKNMQPVDTRPTPLNRPRPDYTEAARSQHISGTARLELLVGTDGIPSVSDILNRLPAGLTARAIRAANEMRFKPATRNGSPVPYYVAIEVEFNLR